MLPVDLIRRDLDHQRNPLGENPLQDSKIMTSEKCAELMNGMAVKAIGEKK
ncbi:MAG: hypothetical protein HN580_24835 [Deltaproteobacteria bacterium]|jgi:hypothetical protein|nr:hypothetical protein [Deltaproteobacteria bacterium]MBT4263416.1 hypothetical protein [Deltaproteobacteria bacterium]MBT4638425.1 hypothetical protein [Deltaproteobacteria bacterium]MBT6502143.1 hypothetical protein [Deltaproteobacteria bacterium]MBT6615579.1 hypothetical protein [Deltaproteobacteria bacterium]